MRVVAEEDGTADVDVLDECVLVIAKRMEIEERRAEFAVLQRNISVLVTVEDTGGVLELGRALKIEPRYRRSPGAVKPAIAAR